MDPRAAHATTIWKSSIHRSVVWIVAIGVALTVSLLLLAGCGESGPAETVDSTVAPSANTSPPETASPTAASGLPKLVDLGSNSCVPCQMIAPELEALAQEYAGSLDVVIVDVYENEALARELRIRVIPTQIWLDPEGNELLRHDGYISKEDILSRFQMLGYPLTQADTSSEQETGSGDGGG